MLSSARSNAIATRRLTQPLEFIGQEGADKESAPFDQNIVGAPLPEVAGQADPDISDNPVDEADDMKAIVVCPFDLLDCPIRKSDKQPSWIIAAAETIIVVQPQKSRWIKRGAASPQAFNKKQAVLPEREIAVSSIKHPELKPGNPQVKGGIADDPRKSVEALRPREK
jgi:hypothetical protein